MKRAKGTGRIGVAACLKAMLMLMLMLTAGEALAFDPPRIIGVLTSPQENQNGFATDFCWVGDQNGDGSDDLLISQEIGATDTSNRVYLFRGGQEFRNEPVFSFRGYDDRHAIRSDVCYLGHLFGREREPLMGMLSFALGESYTLNAYNRSEELRHEYIFSLYLASVDGGHINRPCDFNGDGYDDVITVRTSELVTSRLQICYGGAEFDTIPDWETITVPRLQVVDYAAGRDFNGDGCGDIVVYYAPQRRSAYYSVYLGGATPDTVAAFQIIFEDYALSNFFAALPDINGDGCDEWGAYWSHFHHPDDPGDTLPTGDGFYVFMGGVEVDTNPDLRLEGTPDQWPGYGAIAGGDFNGDGFGDIVVQTGGSDEDHGEASELMFHFGNRWIFNEEVGANGREPDLFVDMGREYNGEYAHEYHGHLGAIGDYNGDRVDDFVWTAAFRNQAIVFAGNRGWRVDVPKESNEKPDSFRMTLDILPNPFNNNVFVKFSLSRRSQVKINTFDITGRLVSQIAGNQFESGDYSFPVTDLNTGLYFIVLETEHGRLIQKAVCIK